MTDVQVIHGDALTQLRLLPAASVDAVITDPPYELGFMGKRWDSAGIAYSVELWAECLRVLKPGGHLAAFGGSRTYHRMACAVEDAGFEIRDSLQWIYGSGFPKSLDVSKAIDKARDDKPDMEPVRQFLRAARDRAGLSNREVAAAFGYTSTMAAHWIDHPSQPSVPKWEQWLRLRELLGFGGEMDAEVWRLNGRKGTPGEAWDQREITGVRSARVGFDPDQQGGGGWSGGQVVESTPATDAARTWAGWGTALKPAVEPIVLARKPLAGTVAANVLAHGVGGLNIDATRVAPLPGDYAHPGNDNRAQTTTAYGVFEREGRQVPPHARGRWPSNVLLSHGEECADQCAPGCPVAELDAQSGTSTSSAHIRHNTERASDMREGGDLGARNTTSPADSGGASRFFPTFRYQAKAPSKERPKVDGIAHPTVKPLALMRWLVRLLCPPGGLVLDPFTGSGTTIEACIDEGMSVIGIEQAAEYQPHIQVRIDRAQARRTATPGPELDVLFDLADLESSA